MPVELAAIQLRVIGLARCPSTTCTRACSARRRPAAVDNRYSATGPYWFTDLKQAYDYPAYSASTDGSGVSVAVLMSDLIFPDDVAAMFNHEKFTALTGKPAPTVTTVLVDGGGVEDGDGSVEASLDVQQVLGGAPGAKVTLVSIPDLSDDHIMDGYQYIIDSNKYDIVNSSFGGCELRLHGGVQRRRRLHLLLQQYHELFQQGNAQGITFVASSGDEAGLECPSADYFYGGTSATFVPSVSTPAADPAVTAVGGGNLVTTSSTTSLESAYVRETANADPEAPYDPYGVGVERVRRRWGAGGGVSVVFKKPLYQAWPRRARTLAHDPRRGHAGGRLPASAISCSADDSAVDHRLRRRGIGGDFYG